MKFWLKLGAAAALPLLLSSCLWGPGKFSSSLELRKAGTFRLAYQGEIMLQLPDRAGEAVAWNDEMARCYVDGEPERTGTSIAADSAFDGGEAEPREPRPCTAGELASLKADHERESREKIGRERAESEQVAALLGLPGSDDESNRRFAANLAKQKGWQSVTYKGRGLFEVDYRFEGSLAQDFVFPLMPDSDLLIPFITIRPRADGTVKVSAPALVGGAGTFAARAKALGLEGKGQDGPPSRAEGRFTVTTDGELLTNNSEEGPVASPGGSQLYWDVGPSSRKIPELLVRL